MSKQPRTFGVSFDRKHDKEWQDYIARSRVGMLEAAEQGNPLPERFTVAQHRHHAYLVITDTETGRKSNVALGNYHGARKILNDLYGLPKLTVEERFSEMDLPLEIEGDGFRAVAAMSPFEDDEVMYRIDVDGIDMGEEGVARIVPRFREGTLEFSVWKGQDFNGFIVNDHTIEEAIETVRQDVMPYLDEGGPRP